MTEPVNHVTIFSNGMGHFQRVFNVQVSETKKISIPFKKNSLSDALESLSVFGMVRYSIPPLYTPTNANDTTLKIDPSNVTGSLLSALSGSEFSYSLKGSATYSSGILLGVETVDAEVRGTVTPLHYVSVITNAREITRILLDNIGDYRFDDSSVQSEITKALQKNFQQIKPDSTFIELELASTTKSNEVATVTYKVPVAPWKLRYNIRQDGNVTSLEGAALVDNCTDEDWDKCQISVVTGNPNSFYSPDQAFVNTPVRQTVQIVENTLHGNVSVEEAVGSRSIARKAVQYSSGSYETMRAASTSPMSFGGAESEDYAAPVAEAPGVDAKEVGDFAVFTSREVVTIKAKRSAVIPMFAIGLKEAKIVLIYKENEHSRRPYRALKFVNEATHDLGKGKVGIYKDGLFQGEAVLELTKTGEGRLLPFCLENGVKIVKDSKGIKDNITKISLSKGYSHEERRYISGTAYTITNKKNESFRILIEHVSLLPQSTTPIEVTGAKVEGIEKLSNGHRIILNLNPKEELKIMVSEKHVAETQVAIYDNYNWIVQHLIAPKHSLASNEGVQKCLEIQSDIENIGHAITENKAQISSLSDYAKELRESLATVKGETNASTTHGKWVKSLDATMESIKELKTKQPEIEAQKKFLEKRLSAAIKAVFAEWNA